MIAKKDFLSRVPFDDKILLSNIYDKMLLVYNKGIEIFTDEFYSPNIWGPILKLRDELEINIFTFGIFKEADRRMLAFSPYSDVSFNIDLLRIVGKSKFTNVEHKDYLGALMGLGIIREKIGDVIIDYDNSCAYVPVAKTVLNYIIDNLVSVGNVPVKVEIVDTLQETIPEYSFEEKSIIVTSLRADCIIGALCNISRSKASELIKSRKVLENYAELTEKDELIDFDTVITIRGYGKYKLLEETGSTQKGRKRLLVKKYI